MFDSPTFVFIHVAISLVGIATGFVVLGGLLSGRHLAGWTGFFLATTLATSVTGFLFPFTRVLPSHVTGVISLVVLGLAYYALYGRRLQGRWRAAYVITAVLALYLNVFVGIVQTFLKFDALQALAPTQAEPPFAVAQGSVLVAFAAVTRAALKQFGRAA